MRLEIYPVKERDGSRKLPRKRGTIRVIWIVGESNRSPLSGGFTLRSAPTF